MPSELKKTFRSMRNSLGIRDTCSQARKRESESSAIRRRWLCHGTAEQVDEAQ
jgi:hypothetical protein